ncbi:MAG: hypothetical protein AAGG51_08515 [Cyanobacteria bacterium P01_G01_bin.54]
MLKKFCYWTTQACTWMVAIAILTRMTNELRFVMTQPAAESYNYVGQWQSHQAWGVAGRILADLPEPLPQGKSFTVEAWVYYNITSLYGGGRFVPMELEAFIEPSGTTSGDNLDRPVPPSSRITFKFKGGRNGEQTIDYVSTANDELTQITGGYRSTAPADLGVFSLKKAP